MVKKPNPRGKKDFFESPQFKKALMKAVRASNKKQRELVKEYDKGCNQSKGQYPNNEDGCGRHFLQDYCDCGEEVKPCCKECGEAHVIGKCICLNPPVSSKCEMCRGTGMVDISLEGKPNLKPCPKHEPSECAPTEEKKDLEWEKDGELNSLLIPCAESSIPKIKRYIRSLLTKTKEEALKEVEKIIKGYGYDKKFEQQIFWMDFKRLKKKLLKKGRGV
jgi:hypothetical protein